MPPPRRLSEQKKPSLALCLSGWQDQTGDTIQAGETVCLESDVNGTLQQMSASLRPIAFLGQLHALPPLHAYIFPGDLEGWPLVRGEGCAPDSRADVIALLRIVDWITSWIADMHVKRACRLWCS